MPYWDKAFVAEMYSKQSKVSPDDFFHKSDLILELVTYSLVTDTGLDQLFASINVEEAAPICIINGNYKANMAHKRGHSTSL